MAGIWTSDPSLNVSAQQRPFGREKTGFSRERNKIGLNKKGENYKESEKFKLCLPIFMMKRVWYEQEIVNWAQYYLLLKFVEWFTVYNLTGILIAQNFL